VKITNWYAADTAPGGVSVVEALGRDL